MGLRPIGGPNEDTTPNQIASLHEKSSTTVEKGLHAKKIGLTDVTVKGAHMEAPS